MPHALPRHLGICSGLGDDEAALEHHLEMERETGRIDIGDAMIGQRLTDVGFERARWPVIAASAARAMVGCDWCTSCASVPARQVKASVPPSISASRRSR